MAKKRTPSVKDNAQEPMTKYHKVHEFTKRMNSLKTTVFILNVSAMFAC